MEQCVTVIGVRVLGDYRLELTFSDGRQGQVDLRNRVVGRSGVCAPLEDAAFFRQVRVDAELGTIVWPNGMDVCPDLLYSLAMGHPLAEAGCLESL